VAQYVPGQVSDLFIFVFLWILCGYVSTVYAIRIRDTYLGCIHRLSDVPVLHRNTVTFWI
jgi:hypothetical protein